MRPAPATAPTNARAMPTKDEESATASLPAAVLLAEGAGLVGLEAEREAELLPLWEEDPVGNDAEGVLEPEEEPEGVAEGVPEGALPLAETREQGQTRGDRNERKRTYGKRTPAAGEPTRR